MHLLKFIACCALCISLPVVADVTVRNVNYKGWASSVEVSNGVVQLVVVPTIGRIMHYGFADDENIIWTNPEFYGQALTDKPRTNKNGKPIWTNFGGDKVWPNQQSEFEHINGYSWPPDHWFDGAKHKVELLENGVVITSPVSEYNGARSVREIRMAAKGTRIQILQRIEKLKVSRVEPLRYTIWNVTQITPPEQVLFLLNPNSHLELGYSALGGKKSTVAKNFAVTDGVGVFLPDAVECQKAGADSDRWLAAIVGNIVMAEFFRRDVNQTYPDDGLSVEVYTCTDYTELELLSPWVYLEVGQVLEHAITWELHRLSDHLDTADQRRAAAIEWLMGSQE
ncbi:MAG: DUF4380 domain-containing protein [Arenicellales bacterium]|nr:DUF4380 domain-containing protein [Arenicellales bacterium]